MSIKSSNFYQRIEPWLIWLLAALFFFSEYFARVSPSITTEQLMAYFQVGALGLGNLSAFFYYPYIAMQIPVGSVVDRFGAHRILTCAALICGLSCFLFAHGLHIRVAELSRALMGFSGAFAFVGTLKLATLWFPPRRLGLLAGLTQGMGMLGAAIGQGLFGMIVAVMGWQFAIDLIGVILIIIAFLIGFIVHDDNPHARLVALEERPRIKISEGLLAVFKNRFTWPNAIFVGLLYAPTAAFAELWGPTYLHSVYHLNQQTANWAISLIFIGWAVGGPLMGFFSDRIGRRRPSLFLSALLSLIFIVVILYVPQLPIALLFITLFAYGVANTGVAVGYAVAGELTELSVSGVSIAFANMMSIAVGALFQPVIGLFLQSSWDGKLQNGVPIYEASAYHYAMLVLPLCLALAVITSLFIRETYCQRLGASTEKKYSKIAENYHAN